MLLSASAEGSEAMLIAPAKTVLPLKLQLPASVEAGAAAGYLRLWIGGAAAADAPTAVGEVAFALEQGAEAGGSAGASDANKVVVTVTVSAEAEIQIEVAQPAADKVVGSLTIPAVA